MDGNIERGDLHPSAPSAIAQALGLEMSGPNLPETYDVQAALLLAACLLGWQRERGLITEGRRLVDEDLALPAAVPTIPVPVSWVWPPWRGQLVHRKASPLLLSDPSGFAPPIATARDECCLDVRESQPANENPKGLSAQSMRSTVSDCVGITGCPIRQS
jgi:hypothetical protein